MDLAGTLVRDEVGAEIRVTPQKLGIFFLSTTSLGDEVVLRVGMKGGWRISQEKSRSDMFNCGWTALSFAFAEPSKRVFVVRFRASIRATFPTG